MRSSVLLFLFCITQVFPSFSQNEILDKNQLGLALYAQEDFERPISFNHALASGNTSNGRLHILNKTSNSYYSFKYYSIKPSADFYVEMAFARIQGNRQLGNGLLFNYSTTIQNNCYEFIISDNKAFKITKTIDGHMEDVTDWIPCIEIKPSGQHKIGLLARGEVYYFYINNGLVYSMDRPTYLGNNWGYSIAPHTDISVVSFLVLYNPPKVHSIQYGAKAPRKQNIGEALNSGENECFPVVSADGKMMAFSRGENIGVKGIDKRGLYFSIFDEQIGKWKTAKPFPDAINQNANLQMVYISPDKKEIIINGTYDSKGDFVSEHGLSVSHCLENKWTVPENIKIEGFENLSLYESYAFSVSNNVMIVSLQTSTRFVCVF
jgi:hypothetical protein